MTVRILVFEDDTMTRDLLASGLRKRGYEVLAFPSPVTCSLVSDRAAFCSHEHACADIVITDMNMPCMTGLEFVWHQYQKNCKCPPENKAVVSAELSWNQEQEFASLGCRYFQKPFKLGEILAWASECERRIPAGRILIPSNSLWKRANDPPQQ